MVGRMGLIGGIIKMQDKLSEGLALLFTWQILFSSIVIYYLLNLSKKMIEYYNPSLLKDRFTRIFLTLLNLIFGISIGLIPDFLPGDNFSQRVISGIVAGFLSNYIYTFLKKLHFQEHRCQNKGYLMRLMQQIG